MSIKSLKARAILNSLGNPTVEVDLETDKGQFRASVGTGNSPNEFSAQELRDNDKAHYHGKGVSMTVDNINQIIAPNLIRQKFDLTKQQEIDQYLADLDGSEKKTKFGSNATLAVSMAICRAGAAQKGVPLYRHIGDLAGRSNLILPVPAMAVLSTRKIIKELMIVPIEASTFAQAMKMGSEVFHHLKILIIKKHGLQAANGVNDKGAFCPPGLNDYEALELAESAIDAAGYTGKIGLALDIVGSEFYSKKELAYDIEFRGHRKGDIDPPKKLVTAYQLNKMYKEWMEDFPIISMEDPFDKNDWKNWAKITNTCSIQIVADDLTGTNSKRISDAVERKACDCILLKKLASVTEAIEVHNLARDLAWGTVVTHRSEETEDSFIADLVVGLSCGQIKGGSVCRSELVGKYNQLMRIEEELGGKAKFAGRNFRYPQ